jgi:hypothetical protein
MQVARFSQASHFERIAMTRTARPLLAVAMTLLVATSASAFHRCHCCYYAAVPLVPTVGVGAPVTSGHTIVNTGGLVPAHTFAFGTVPTPLTQTGILPMQHALTFSTVSIPGVVNTGGLQPAPSPSGTVPGPSAAPPTGGAGLTEAQYQALIARLNTTDGRLNDIWALLNAIADKTPGIRKPTPTTFPPTRPTSTSEGNAAETRRLLATIAVTQSGWAAASTESTAKIDAKAAEVRRLLADVSAKQASWKTSTDSRVAASK